MLVPVILSGGNGSRLWPISREAYPKPFIRFNDSLSLLQTTYQRALSIPNVKQMVTVTHAEHYYQSKMELKNLPLASQKVHCHFLLEPISRNTAPAIILSALFVQELVGLDATLLILPTDQTVTNQHEFNYCVEQAVHLAQQNLLVTFGIIPNQSETGYGYIQYSTLHPGYKAYHVKNFHEKPSQEEANFFIKQGNYLWNSGIFCFSVSTFIKTIEKYNPELYLQICHCWELTKKSIFFKKKSIDKLYLDKDSFYQLDNISIDYALMEKAKNIVVMPTDFGWSDIGSWDSFSKLLKSDEGGNRTIGHAILQQCQDTTIYNQNPSKRRVIAAVGLKNLIIVDTFDGLLIAKKDQVQNVKDIVKELKEIKHESYQTHQTVERPWGHYTVLAHEKNYKLKRIIINPGSSLSLQIHRQRSEHWIVIQGVATVQNNQSHFTLKEQESTFIPVGNKHRLSNETSTTLIIIELQLGSYLGEDDIIRLKDNYDRNDPIIEEEVSLLE
ncbi:mannose-1-phosphate guanylyltransferase/mannose-6-phosphate isomerase [Rickettsiella endosymbiont of Dermanyssus gallinae]|uniref:mannose-1-phosphate guanylyltransferase/mannose-6-phosphate isomerase n=1 Tax=Rickettsiella endosymbiont of Dermanyssus gallinae TaxID=2856608 RepID=UPI001C5335F5|nr:mannose-1-phosphate guanylyltransferase/mannose-6-phosphate isomerase [Rickettsiella endosymbiont of Dermanyssus gallinae]